MMVLGRLRICPRCCPASASSTRYLAKSIAVPLIGSLILAAMLLLLDKMLRLFQYVVDAGGPVSVVWRMLANLLPEYLSLGIPIGLMLGILLAFRKLALSSELDALRGIGVGYGRLLRVPYALHGPARDHQPADRRLSPALQPSTATRACASTSSSGALGAAIKVGEFNQLGRRLTLRIERSEKKGTQLHGIFVETDDGKGTTVAATAEQRTLPLDRRSRRDPVPARPRAGSSSNRPSSRLRERLPSRPTTLPVSLPAIDQFRRRGGTESRRALPARAVRASATAAGPPTSISASRRRRNLNFRLVEVLMMFMLPLLAVVARSAAEAQLFGPRHLPRDPDRGRLSQGQPIRAAGRRQRSVEPDPRLVGAADRSSPAMILWMYHVLAHQPGRPADRRARALLRQGREARRARCFRSRKAPAAEA